MNPGKTSRLIIAVATLIEFTSHADQATLKYYKGRMTIEDKEKLLEKKLGSNVHAGL